MTLAPHPNQLQPAKPFVMHPLENPRVEEARQSIGRFLLFAVMIALAMAFATGALVGHFLWVAR